MGSYLLTLTMESNPDLGFESYDRLFPNQDQMPQGGFGNLIALPLQGGPRKQGNSVFVDDCLKALPNQWQLLASVEKMSVKNVTTLAELAQTKGRVTGVRLPVTDNEEQPWQLPPSRKSQARIPAGELPSRVDIVIGNQIYVDRKGLPAPLVNRIIRLAAFQNPEFYRAQAMRMPVYNKPRIISCAELFPSHIGLPRGCAQGLTELLMALKILPAVTDNRNGGVKTDFNFCGELRTDQADAVSQILPNDLGVLAASTAFGKTVAAIYMIAKRNVNTLILVHRRQLIDQWRSQLSAFLGINEGEIGIIGGGKQKPNGKLDIATLQSLYRNHEVDNIVANYGHIVVDECHHVSAVSFEEVLRQCNARFVLGLSATVCRKDGHHPIIFMQCGPVRYKTSSKDEAEKRPFSHKVFVRPTTFEMTSSDYKISDVYAAMVSDEPRNDLIVQDVIAALENDRSPLILTERNDHIELLYDRLCGLAMNLIVLKGGMGKRRYQDVMEQLGEIPDTEERVILATGKYIGEGFDDPRLDTLFLTMPISWRGTLTQYAGRLHRLHAWKREVQIYDYADMSIGMTSRMFEKRKTGYKSMGYDILEGDPRTGEWQQELF